MASLRLAIAASLKEQQAPSAITAAQEPERPSKAPKQDKALPAKAAKSSPPPQRKRGGKEAATGVEASLPRLRCGGVGDDLAALAGRALSCLAALLGLSGSCEAVIAGGACCSFKEAAIARRRLAMLF